jgi:very-short-patch-repair endonuclease
LDEAYDRQPTRRSRELRANATAAERKLWQHIRNRQLLGTRFNTQVPIGPHICDFAARTPRLIIELDGGQHASSESYDSKRTSFLKDRGYRVLRFWNDDVLENLEGVLSAIADALTIPSRHAGGDEPRSGEGEGMSRAEENRPSPSPSRRAGGE